MPIAHELEEALKSALKARDKALASCIRQVKAKVQEAENAPQFRGEKDDAFYLDVIARYRKMLAKSVTELEAAGPRAAELVKGYRFELDYLARYMPAQLSEDSLAEAARTLVREGKLVAADAGRAMGQLLGRFRGQLTPERARAAIASALQAAKDSATEP